MSNSWTIGAALLDLDNPHKLIARTPGYILQPANEYEMSGIVPNVTFPEGAVIVGETLYVYYGAADTTTCVAYTSLNDLIYSIRPETSKDFRFKRLESNPIISPKSEHLWVFNCKNEDENFKITSYPYFKNHFESLYFLGHNTLSLAQALLDTIPSTDKGASCDI